VTRIVEGRGIVDRIELDGMKISIEVEAGGSRSGVNSKGERWENKVHSAYGYILGTNSPDGEHLDVWVKKNPKEGKRVYVIHQLTPDGSRYDEDKVMLGFNSAEQAIAAFKREAFKPEKMFGGLSEFDIEHFKVIAYQASNSSAMLASQRMYDKFEEKGLLPKGIKSPIQVAQIVKEGSDMLHISYEKSLIAESAFDLALSAGLKVLKSNNDVMFESEADLREFIRLIDESQEDNAHLGDLYEALPESFEQIVESNLSDAIADLKSELRVDDGDAWAVCDEIAKDYGLTGDQLAQAFERATGKRVPEYAAFRDQQKAANADAQRKTNLKTMTDAQKIAIMRKAGKRALELIDQGYEKLEAVEKAFQEDGFTRQEIFLLKPALERMLVDKGLGHKFRRSNESIDATELQRLAGIRSTVVESTGTPTVHAVKSSVTALTESHNTALRQYMVGYARAKQNKIMESISDIDMDAALRRLANTLLMHPQAPTDKIVAAVAEAAVRGDQRSLVEHVGNTTGLSVDAFREAITQRAWDDNRITRQVFESLMESTEANWNLNCPDKGTAFKKACR
jgi:Inorganic Pyrophosphatase